MLDLTKRTREAHGDWAAFVGRTLIVATLLVVFAALWFATRVFLLAFLGLLVGLLLQTLADWWRRATGLRYGWSLLVVVLLLAALIGLAGWLIGERIADQFNKLAEQLPSSWRELQQQLSKTSWGAGIMERLPTSLTSGFSRADLVSQFSSAASSIVAAASGLIVVLAVGVYLAADPAWYLGGAVQLAPPGYRPRLEDALRRAGAALRWWLLAQLATMTVVGVATGLGLWWAGVPLALSLGLLALLLEIIPNFGPLLAALPALLLGWSQGGTTVLWVAAVFLVVQGLESYVVLPLAQQQAARLPPALSILAIVLFGLVAGLLGVLAAAPLTVAAIVLVKTLYVRDVLGDADATRANPP